MWAMGVSVLALSLPFQRASAQAPGDTTSDVATPGGEAPNDAARASTLRAEGIRLGEQGLWRQSLIRLTASAALEPHPATLHHLGQAQRALSQWVEVCQTLRQLLESPAARAAQPYLLQARAGLLEAEANVSVLKLVVQPTSAVGLVAEVDGVRLSERQLHDDGYVINPGSHLIRMEALDLRPTEQRVTVHVGETAVVTITLPPAEPKAPKVAPILPPTPESSARPLDEWIAIGAIGGGSAALVAGATIGLVAIAQAANAAEGESIQADAAKDKAIVADLFGAVGVVSLGVGIVMLLNAGSASTSPATGTSDGFVLRF